jgi:hypothetical protein
MKLVLLYFIESVHYLDSLISLKWNFLFFFDPENMKKQLFLGLKIWV